MASLIGHWEDWKEEVMLHDGRVLIVDREVFIEFRLTCGDMGSPQTFCNSPSRYRLTFVNPDTSRKTHWEGDDGFNPFALGIVDRIPYLVVTGSSVPRRMDSHPECNGTPFFYYRYEESNNRWRLISGGEAPVQFRQANLMPSYDNRYKGKTLPVGEIISQLMNTEDPGQTGFFYQVWLPRNPDEWQYLSKSEFLNSLRRMRKDCQEKFGPYRASLAAPQPSEIVTAKTPEPANVGDNRHGVGKKIQKASPPHSFKDCVTCPEMVPIPGKNYAIGKYEVTFGEWDSLMNYALDSHRARNTSDRNPARFVSWPDEEKFIAELNKKTGKEYRLPTSDEWLHACFADENTKYCGSDDADAVGWHFRNSESKSHEVGNKRPNKFGLHDMTGSEWEMMGECIRGNCSHRVIRGGSRYRYPLPALDAYIYGVSEKHGFGFRLLRPMQ